MRSTSATLPQTTMRGESASAMLPQTSLAEKEYPLQKPGCTSHPKTWLYYYTVLLEPFQPVRITVTAFMICLRLTKNHDLGRRQPTKYTGFTRAYTSSMCVCPAFVRSSPDRASWPGSAFLLLCGQLTRAKIPKNMPPRQKSGRRLLTSYAAAS